MKRVKKIMLFLAIFVIIFLLTFVIPIKVCRTALPTEEFYVVEFYGLRNGWYLVGDNTGMLDENLIWTIPVVIEGKNPQARVSKDLYFRDTGTRFIIYGSAIINEYTHIIENSEDMLIERRYLLNSMGWDILGDVNSRNPLRFALNNFYLTIYDYKWFDDFRGFFGLLDSDY